MEPPAIPPGTGPTVSSSSTLPSAFYLDPAVLPREMERVLGRSWQLAGHAADVQSPGDYVTVEAAGEPLIVRRDRSGALGALSNVCRHRAGPVAAGRGRRNAFTCGYHGWTYDADGRLLRSAGMEGAEGFDQAAVCLPRHRADTWGPLVFVCLQGDPPPLAAALRPLVEAAGHLPLAGMRFARRRDYTVACNWKVYVDNYLEGYHIPIVHPGLFEMLDFDKYRSEPFDGGTLQVAPLRRDDDQALYFWFYPNLMVNVYRDNFSTNLIVPQGHDRTLTVFEWFQLEPDTDGARRDLDRIVQTSDEIQQEDIRICEAVQKGLASRGYDTGRYAPRHEIGLHHFHRLLRAALGENS
jgi:choline monooxygenase